MSVYDSVVTGLKEAIEYEKGNLKARTSKCTVAPVPDFNAEEIREVRASLDMTQATFAAVMGVSKKTVEAWESGINVPIGTARRMLSMIKTDNSILEKFDIISA